ncbi:hypothetical protein DUNSADRAFT_13096 [Dunaliella salina]|uniref:Encoded protein n=1 Tax=Dunaliella salina TaxID=3046 RepID=A0ABQ7GA40_DUNSA|nr:hypothetical protein DUNSADRAFT_13096 [Dunaliella salina]|eukprot:KAF5831474.1 hypothetical protein DUNSADRAFT_13096 [Dunaliella salina]
MNLSRPWAMPLNDGCDASEVGAHVRGWSAVESCLVPLHFPSILSTVTFRKSLGSCWRYCCVGISSTYGFHDKGNLASTVMSCMEVITLKCFLLLATVQRLSGQD